jgi:hypothetical protein
MALIFAESFDGITTISQLHRRRWNSNNTSFSPGVSNSAGRRGGGCLTTIGSGYGAYVHLIDEPSTVIVGVALYFEGGLSSPGSVITCSHDGQDHIGVYLFSDNRLGVRLGSGSTFLQISESNLLVSPNEWSYIEFKVTIAVSGSYEVRVNGRTFMSATGVQTYNAGTAAVKFVGINGLPISTGGGLNTSGSDVKYDDFYVCDTTGSFCNDFLGDIRVDDAYPNSDGASTDWTPLGGSTHYTEVDESAIDDDTSYISEATVNGDDLFGFPALGFTPSSVKGVMISAAYKADADGERVARSIGRVSGTTYEAENYAREIRSQWYNLTGASFTYANDYGCFSYNPATAAAWAQAAVEAAEFGVRLDV